MTATTQRRPGLAQRTVEGLAHRVARRDLSRRSFLVRLAVVGSVLTVAPLRWALRPTSAYAAVCGDEASCDGGWTAFCCTINDGANTCPPGSFAAGWWKIDASPFCQGEPRYIIDCNRSPDASCDCECADTDTCDRRRVCCNEFRYGQCNTDVPGTTEVVCRVVLCTVPWEWDPACGTSVRTDNRTRTHNAPCLPGEDATPIDLHYQDLGLSGSVLGAPSAAEQAGPRSGAWRRFEHGLIAWHEDTGAHELLGVAARRYEQLGGPEGRLGYPTGGAEQLADGHGERIRFEHGHLYVRGETAVAVTGAAAERYARLGGPGGELGRPTESTQSVGDGRGWVTDFEHGAILAVGVAARELTGGVLERYRELGGPQGSGLGYPLGADDDGVQRFEQGALVPGSPGHVVLRDPIARRFRQLGGLEGPWGAPVADQEPIDEVQRAVFEEATVFARGSRRAWAVREPVLARYEREGGPAGALGAPTADSFLTRGGDHRGVFEAGAIEVDASTGGARVVHHRGTRAPSDLT